QRVERRGQRRLQGGQLRVHLDAQRLESPLGGVAPGAPGRGGDGLANDVREPLRRGYCLFGTFSDDQARDTLSESLLAVVTQNAGEVGGGVRVDHLFGRQLLRGVHAHVERRVVGVGEP